MQTVPNFAKVRHWESRELYGNIFVWHDAENRPPEWKIPEVAEVLDGLWHFRGRTQHDVLAHVQVSKKYQKYEII